MGHYWKIKCPVCGAETMSSKEEGLKVECSHFGRFVPEQSLVLYYNDLGEEIPVRLDDVGQACYKFTCPICSENIEACATMGAHQYYVKTNCTHFITLRRGENDKITAIFYDSFNNAYPVEVG